MSDRSIELGPLAEMPEALARQLHDWWSALQPLLVPSAATGVACDAPTAVDWVQLMSTTDRMSADLVRSRLASAGFDVQLVGYEDSPPWGAATPPRPIEVWVPLEDKAAASELLETE